MNYGYVYLTTNLINNKKYIGQHKSKKFDESYKGSGKVLLQAIDLHGWDNFSCEILEWADSKETLNELEKFYINEYDAVNSREFYNLVRGGLGDSESGLKFVNNGVHNKKVKECEVSYYLSQGYVLGRTSPTQATIQKRAMSNTGQKRTQETKNNISNAHKGKVLTEEHKLALRKPKSVANWRKGLISVHKDNDYINIKPNELDHYLSMGYVRGSKKHSKESSNRHREAILGRVYVTNDIIYKHPKVEELDYYLSIGWRVGKPKRK